jgi:prolyl-tRNA editing enzyme YbaK/EbsC (Cys-tRNA(Pro) deacylase)
MNEVRRTTQLEWVPVSDAPEFVADPVRHALVDWPGAATAEVAEIDAALADTAAFCATYGVSLAESANCVPVAGKRDGQIRYAACMVLATPGADVNGVVRRLLDVRKASFAAMDEATSLTGMQYGGITLVGLPAPWPIFVAEQLLDAGSVIIGSGIRSSKLRVPAEPLLSLPAARAVPDLAKAL